MQSIPPASAGRQLPQPPYPPLRSIRDLSLISEDDPSYLLRSRLFRRGEVAALVGSAGLGKSTVATQMAMMWSAGLPIMGLTPLNPMRIVIIQAENDDADLGLMVHGIQNSLSLHPDSTNSVENNLRLVELTSGERLWDALAYYCRQHTPDLIILDPVLAYFEGHVASASDFGGFLRRIAADCRRLDVAALLVHHTGKVKKGATDVDPVYGGIGSSEFGNVPRITFTLSSVEKNRPDLARLVIGKRSGRSPWVDLEGNTTPEILLRRSHDPNAPCWVPCAPDDVQPAPAGLDRLSTAREAILAHLQSGAMDTKSLFKAVHGDGVSKASCTKATKDLIEAGDIERFERPRSGTRAQVLYRLSTQNGHPTNPDKVN